MIHATRHFYFSYCHSRGGGDPGCLALPKLTVFKGAFLDSRLRGNDKGGVTKSDG